MTRAVVSALALGRLDGWLQGRLPGYAGRPALTPLGGGQSAPTFRLDSGGQSWVLRKRPAGEWPRYLYRVDREFRVLQALAESDVPVPRAILLCEDPNVLEGEFYIMEYVSGRILHDVALPECTPQERRMLLLDLARVCGRIHGFDWQTSRLPTFFSRRDDYVQRQLNTLADAYRNNGWQRIASLERLIEWLPAKLEIPAATSLVHGDFKLGNCVIDSRAPRIRAVLDWELSTLGNPWPDAAFLVQPWILPLLPMNPQGNLAGLNLRALGIPTREEMLTACCEQSGMSMPSRRVLDHCSVFNLFRTAIVTHSVGARQAMSAQDDAVAAAFGEMASPIADFAWHLAVHRLDAR